MKKRINYSSRLLRFKKDRTSEQVTSVFPVTVVEKDLFKAVVTNAREKIILFGDRLFHKYQTKVSVATFRTAATECNQEPHWDFLENRPGIVQDLVCRSPKWMRALYLSKHCLVSPKSAEWLVQQFTSAKDCKC